MALQCIIIPGGSNIGYDVTNMCAEITWSGRKGSAPRSLKMTLIDDDLRSRVGVDCANGDQCILLKNGIELFRGMIISHRQSASKKMPITAYDNMYYLANNKDSFCYTGRTGTQIFNDCMQRLGMTGGDVVDTRYIIPELPKSKTTYYDVLLDALSTTYKATGIRYYIGSDKGNVHLRRRSENALQWVLESGSDRANLTDYDYFKSIDKVRTRVRLLSKENAIVYEKVNSALEGKIGAFMEVKTVDNTYSQAQMQELVESVFEESGNPTETLSVSGIGISDAISGMCVYVIIPQLGIGRTFYIDEDTHRFSGESHTMTLSLNFATEIDRATVSPQEKSYKVGDIVNFYGGYQYISSNATSPAGSKCGPGPAKITLTAPGASHPWHLIHTDASTNVYGWVDNGSFV